MSKLRIPHIFCLGLATAVLTLTLITACTSPSQPTPVAVVETAAPTATAVPACEPFAETAVAPPATVPSYSYRVLNRYPHDPTAFTQGLLFVDGVLYESTGRYPSTLRRVALASGQPEQLINLDEPYFGEGLVLWQDKLIQLTWQNRVAFVYDKESFALLNTWEYETEGWGITHNGRCLIMSDGSATLYFRHPETFAEVGRITVQDANGPVPMLNELEYINGEVWANIWQTDRIVRIDPATGQVVGSIDFTGLLDPATLTQPANVLNGIAYDAENGRLFITGKLWPTLFEIELVPAEGN
ncbi:MAG: glutaminyl-peptide cyclotransferase [Anaerolineaceae bacterium]|nr:glutaminyl-peptide cyclotransferase [Anaerolineaceae bacterium]